MKNKLLLNLDTLSSLDIMTNEQAGVLIKTIYNYKLNRVQDNIPLELKFILKPIFDDIDNENARVKDILEKRKKSGSIGGVNKKEGLHFLANVANGSKSSKTWQNVANLANGSKTWQNKQTVANVANGSKSYDLIESEKVILDNENYINLLLEYGFERNLILEWFEIRKNKNATNSTTFFKSFIEEVGNSKFDKNECLKICVENSWSTYKEKWANNLKQNTNGQNTKSSNVNYSEEFLTKINDKILSSKLS